MILVTGGTGLLGSHLLYYLCHQNTPVRAIYRSEKRVKKTQSLFSLLGDSEQQLFLKIEWIPCSLLDIPSLESALDGVEQVYHCAGMISFDPSDRKELYRNNVRATERLIDVCLAQGVKRVLYVSSVAATGKEPGGGLIDEESPWNPIDSHAYGQSKYEAELEVWRGQQEGLKTVVVNPGIILGTGFWDKGSDLLFSRIDKGLKIYPPGKASVVSVDNLVRCMYELMQSDIESQRFIVVQEHWTYKTLFAHIARSLKKRRPYVALPRWSLRFLSFLDYCRAQFFNSERRLPPEVVKSLKQPSEYSGQALQKAIGFKFEALEDEIQKNGKLYLSYKKKKRKS